MDAGNHLVIFFSLFGLAIIDWVMLGNWVRGYYQFGVPVYKKDFTYTRDQSNNNLLNFLDNHNKNLSPPFAFHIFDTDTVAFREQYKMRFSSWGGKQRSYTPMMHGIIRFDRISRKVTVTGIANWLSLLFIPAFIYFAVFMTGTHDGNFMYFKLIFVIAPFAVLFFIYRMQKEVYDKIVESLKKIVGGVEY